jgi:uncharacterized repeat protein (TIGR01451 family)
MTKTLTTLFFLLLILLFVVGLAELAAPAVAIIPGAIRTDATFNHIGVLWSVSGDEDLDCSFSLEFREQGTSTWHKGAMGMRAYPTLVVNGDPLGLNYWAASALFLESGVTYELRLTLTDPDGGGDVQVVTATTRTWPKPAANGRQLFVSPGNGGGDGSQSNPFKGLQTAADAAEPGDTFHVTAGIYAPFQLLTSGSENNPIAFIGPGDGTAVVDGNNTSRGVITIGEYDRTLGYVNFSGLTIRNGAWGIDAQHTHDLYIHHNTIEDVGFGIYNRRGDAQENNQTVCDNVITGRTLWPNSGIPSERGIDLRGTGNVVCYNQVQNFGDCISVQPSTGPSFGNDVYGNDAAYCVDDGIEIDYNQASSRVWRNRVTNARMGVSVQPIRGGPAYIFRNEFFNLESVPVKMHNQTTGFIVAHNTGVKHGNGYGDNGAMWRNAILRNNLFLGTRYAFEFTTVPDEGFRDFDYNAWGTSRATGGTSSPYFKWNNDRYDLIGDLPPGVEDHGVPAEFTDLVDAVLPPDWNVSAAPGSRDLRLVSGAKAIDNGAALDNLNDPFPIAGKPDIGAFEFDGRLPEYGPRVETTDMSESSKTASDSIPTFGDVMTYTLRLQNGGAPFSGMVLMTDTVPVELTYISGSLTADLGMVDESSPPELRWSGAPGEAQVVTISYAVTVTTAETNVVTNTAIFDAGTDGLVSPSSTVILNGRAVYLPLLLK